MSRQKITTFLWFNDQAEEAARFYASIFPDSHIDRIVPGPGGEPFLVEFRLAGYGFLALNGGPQYQFNEAISLSVDCEDQAELDRIWKHLTTGGEPVQCGWVKDKFGLYWQVVPACLSELMSGDDPERMGRVMAAMMKMVKLDIATLQQA